MIARRRIVAAAAMAAALVLAATAAGAQAAGTATAQAGFSVETLLAQLSLFVPEEYAGYFGGRGFAGGPGGATGDSPQGGQQQGTTQPQAGQPTQQGQRLQGFAIPQFKRDAKLMLTAKQVDALLPVLQDLQKTPYPTPSQAKKVTSTVEATLTKQQKDAYAKYVKERDKAMEEMRKQFESRAGTQGAQGGFIARGEGGATEGGQAGQGQRQQVDPAEMRRQMLETFIGNLQEYRAGLK